jgi:cyclopropane fatty-acyl-phospholipid synthase-like methyltransferase
VFSLLFLLTWQARTQKVRAFRGMNRQLTYGELTINGIETLLENIEISKDDVFIDVGSGYGKLIEIINQKIGCQTIGIEIDVEKYNISKKIIQNKKNIKIFNGNLLDLANVIKSGTIVYSNCIAFPVSNVEFIYNNCYKTFIHNNFHFFKNNLMNLEVTWSTKPCRYYKLNTITNR